MKNYQDLLRDILDNGTVKEDRTGTGTISLFGRMLRFNLEDEGFPLLTTKKMFFRGIKEELLWFISGDTNIKALTDKDIHIWDAWADENGDLGPVYGKQLRDWEGVRSNSDPVIYTSVDQLKETIENIKKNPYGRRHVITLWNPIDLPDMRLPPCHGIAIHFNVNDDKLSCLMYQRSCDVFLGVPFNIASYALLTHMVAQCVGLPVGEFVHVYGDVHIYSNHVDQVKEQLLRQPYPLPKLVLNPDIKDIDKFTSDDIKLEGYQSHSKIEAPVAV